MKAEKKIVLGIGLTLLLLISSLALSFNARAETATTVENLTFHNYSLVQKADNGSFFAYDGADTIGPLLANAYQTSVNSQIKGTVTVYGIQFTYWSGMIIWGYSLNDDVHVQGNVQITVYMSSSDTISGFLSGGGYGMGLSDVDQNGNEIQRFTVEGPQSMGANPFASTPKAYTLNVQVDYTFAKGHIIAFFAGAGATKQGYKFTVYFDSSDKDSGASLPILNQTPTPSPILSPSPSSPPSQTASPLPTPTFTPKLTPSPSSPTPGSSPSPSPSQSPSSSLSPSPSPSLTSLTTSMPTPMSTPSATQALPPAVSPNQAQTQSQALPKEVIYGVVATAIVVAIAAVVLMLRKRNSIR